MNKQIVVPEFYPVNTVVFIKKAGNTVLRGKIQKVTITHNFISDKDVEVTTFYVVQGHDYVVRPDSIFLTADEAFKS